MNWFQQLLTKPEAEPAAEPGARPPPPSAADCERLRAAYEAANPDQRAGAALALGGALGEAGLAPRAQDGLAVQVAAICHAADKAQGLQWLEGLLEEPALAEVALHGRYAELRLAAAQRLQDGGLLEHTARTARGHDKAVYRHCSELLRQRRHEQQRSEHGARIAQLLQELLETAPISVSRLIELEKELQALGPGADPLEACQARCAEANRRVLQEGQSQRRLQAAQQAAQALAAQLAGAAWPGDSGWAAWHRQALALREDAGPLPGWPAAQAALEQLQHARQAIDAALARLAADGAAIAAAERFLAAQVAPADWAAARAAWGELPRPLHAASCAALDARWAELQAAAAPVAETAPAPVPAPVPAAPRLRVDAEALRQLLHEVEAAIDEGHLADAEAVDRRLKALLATGEADRRLEARVQRAHARLGELRGWAQWSARKQREQLIEAARALLTGAPGVEHISVAVPALREAWKQLNAQGAATKAQWEVFNGALEQAYVPVAQLRAEEAAQRAQAREQREALLVQWEAWLEAIDWAQPDHAALETQAAQWFAQWRAAPHAGFREERQLRKRADALRTRFEQQQLALHQAEVERRRALIQAAEALEAQADLRQATSQVKRLQEQWRPAAAAPRLARGEEQKLWRQFRAACDKVFVRRDAQRGAEQQERAQHSQAREQQLAEFAAVLEGTQAGPIQAALARFQKDWHLSSGPAPQRRGGPPPDRWEREARALQQRALQRLDALRLDGHRARLDALRRPAPDAAVPDEAARAQGHQERESLLLDLEIALDLASPPECQDARRRRQLEKLQNRFRGGTAQHLDAEQLLAHCYAASGSPDARQEQRLSAAAEKILAQQVGRNWRPRS
jgi:hypothetical protein